MRQLDRPLPPFVVGNDTILVQKRLTRPALTLGSTFKIAAVLSWVFETDFTSRQFDDLSFNLAAAWPNDLERKFAIGDYLNSYESLAKTAASYAAQQWRSDRQKTLRSRGFVSTPRLGKPQHLASLDWARALDEGTHRVIASGDYPLTQQAAESFVEASLVMGRVMLHGGQNWRPDATAYSPAVATVAQSWNTVSPQSRLVVIGCADRWPGLVWDGLGFRDWYVKFWLHDLAVDLAAQWVPGFAAFVNEGAREFVLYMKRAAQQAAHEEAQRQERIRQVREQQAASFAPTASSNRQWAAGVTSQMVNNSNAVVDLYNTQTEMRRLQGLYNPPSVYIKR